MDYNPNTISANPTYSAGGPSVASGATVNLPFGKYDPLPGITSPRPDKLTQTMMEQPTMPVPQLTMYPKVTMDLQRMQALELRVASLEQANRVLLDELVSTKNESKGAIRRVESTVSEELMQQRNIQETFRANADFLAQLQSRVKRNEEQIQGGQVAVNNLMEQFRRVNQLVSNGQNNSSGRNDLLDSRLMELHSGMEEGRSERQQILGTAASLSDKVKSLEQRVDQKMQEISSVAIEVRKKSLAIEDQTRTMMDQFKKSQEYQSDLDYSNHQLKTQVDNRLAEFTGILNDLKSKTMKEESERRNSDQLVNRKLADLQFSTSDLQRSYADMQHESGKVRQDMTTLFETESSKLNDQISRFLDEFRRKLHDSEMKMKDETSAKINHLEKSLNEERDSRLNGEKSIKEELRDSIGEMRDKSKEDLQQYKKAKKAEKQKITDSLNVVNEAINSVERHQDEWFDKLTKSLRAEIKTREANGDQLHKKIADLDTKFVEALSLIEREKPSVGGIHVATAPSLGARKETVGGLETDVRLLSGRINRIETTIDEKSKETMMLRESMSMSSSRGIDKINETLNQVIEWYSKSTKQVDDVNSLFLERVAPRIDEIEKELENLKKYSAARIEEEKAARFAANNEVQRDLKRIQKDSQTIKDEQTTSFNKLKIETEQLASAILHFKQSLRQSMEEQIFRIDLQMSEDSKKKTDQIVQVRQDVNHLSSIVEANLLSTSECNVPFRQQLGQPETIFPRLYPDRYRQREKTSESAKRAKQSSAHVQTDSRREIQSSPTLPNEMSVTIKQKPTSPGTAMQTIESFLQEISLTNGKPTRAIQTSKSILEISPSPGVGIQTSFSFESSRSRGVYIQTSPVPEPIEEKSTQASKPQSAEDRGKSRELIYPLAGMNFHAPEGAQLEMVAEVEQKLTKEDSVYQRYLEAQREKSTGEQNAGGEAEKPHEPGENQDSMGSENTGQNVEQRTESQNRTNTSSKTGAKPAQADESHVEPENDGEQSRNPSGSNLGNVRRSREASRVSNSGSHGKPPPSGGLKNSIQKTVSRKGSSVKDNGEPDADGLEYKSQSGNKKRSLPIADDTS
ncbi:uncharacterized protein LOC142339670 isoform X2 [Convolutriloba macropyga]|uniref:uncharacterized protein LOC142339670 isoform X2 n=1 Tax=Convolutriloba macropyga TaxID=536237 RepID=UPI003F5216CF